MIVLASHTGWPPESMLDLPISDFIDFLELLPKKEGA